MMLRGIFLCIFVFDLVAVVPQPVQPHLANFQKSMKETEFLCSDRHAPILQLNVISTRAGSFHCSAR